MTLYSIVYSYNPYGFRDIGVFHFVSDSFPSLSALIDSIEDKDPIKRILSLINPEDFAVSKNSLEYLDDYGDTQFIIISSISCLFLSS
ncbi:MAG: hypothetical protein GY861_21815 [bacterium]|nr:hypothetical protein [bacterium]